MLQRMGLAQALVNDPELLILDEPTSALDPLARVTIRELLLDLRRRGRTIFISSHLLSEIELICDRVAIMNHGRIVRIGRTGDLLQSHEESEIMARGVEPSALAPFRVADMPDSMVRLHVRATEQRAAIERVWSAGGEVVSINPARKSLEQIFVELTCEPTPRAQAKGN
jgi:ABC-2 type transport system ATP-binding protein